MRLRAFPPRPALLLLAGALVFFPALLTPVFMDDFLHRAMVDGTYVGPRGPTELYDLFDPGERAPSMETGALPWWTDARFSIRFMRPLSSALLWLDHRVFRDAPLLPHVHSLLWWACAVLGARVLFRRLLAPRAAAFASVVFALGPCHAAPIAWLANREELVALALGVWALGFYVRARGVREHLAAAGLFSAAMLAGEYALCAGGYVVAIEAATFREREGARRRLARVATFLGPALAYVAARRVLGYGAPGSGFYRDPLNEPLLYLQTAPRRLATLFLDGWLDADADGWCSQASAIWLLLAVAVGAAIILLAVSATFRSLTEEQRRTALWMLAGSLLALTPLVAVAPSIRLVGASLPGVAGVVGMVLDRAWFPPSPAPRPALFGFAALSLGFLHLVHAPVSAFIDARGIRAGAFDFQRRAAEIAAELREPDHDTVLLLRASFQTTLFGRFAVGARGALPARFRALTQTPGHVLVLRDDERTVEIVVPKDQSLFPNGPDDLFRSEQRPLRAGDVVELPGMRVTVVDADEHGTHRIRYELDRSATDASLVWLVEERAGIARAELPEIGFGKPFDP